jgi:hypothetical protein
MPPLAFDQALNSHQRRIPGDLKLPHPSFHKDSLCCPISGHSWDQWLRGRQMDAGNELAMAFVDNDTDVLA